MKKSVESKPAGTYVWDRPTRLFHWLLLPVFTVSLTTGLMADIDLMQWHLYSGYTLLGLLVFRLLTGLLGGDYSRFDRLPLSISSLRCYIKEKRVFIGHNPLGSWMVVIILLALLTQVFSGLMSTDGIFIDGPWVAWAEDHWVSVATAVHGSNYWLLIVLTTMHIAAIVLYTVVGKKDLLGPMLVGYRKDTSAEPSHPVSIMSLPKLLLLVVIALLVSLWLVGL